SGGRRRAGIQKGTLLISLSGGHGTSLRSVSHPVRSLVLRIPLQVNKLAVRTTEESGVRITAAVWLRLCVLFPGALRRAPCSRPVCSNSSMATAKGIPSGGGGGRARLEVRRARAAGTERCFRPSARLAGSAGYGGSWERTCRGGAENGERQQESLAAFRRVNPQ